MSKEMLKQAALLCKEAERNTPVIEEKLRRAGVNPDDVRPIIFSAAMYYDALNKLAEE